MPSYLFINMLILALLFVSLYVWVRVCDAWVRLRAVHACGACACVYVYVRYVMCVSACAYERVRVRVCVECACACVVCRVSCACACACVLCVSVREYGGMSYVELISKSLLGFWDWMLYGNKLSSQVTSLPIAFAYGSISTLLILNRIPFCGSQSPSTLKPYNYLHQTNIK